MGYINSFEFNSFHVEQKSLLNIIFLKGSLSVLDSCFVKVFGTSERRRIYQAASKGSENEAYDDTRYARNIPIA